MHKTSSYINMNATLLVWITLIFVAYRFLYVVVFSRHIVYRLLLVQQCAQMASGCVHQFGSSG